MRNLVPQFILNHLAKQNYQGMFKTAVMFCDISGFTKMTDELMQNGKEGAEVLSNIINNVFTPAINSVYSNHGFVSTFGGDSFYAVFPDKENICVLSAASEIRETFKLIGAQKTKFGEFDLSVKIGVSYGEIKWGIVGEPDSINQLVSYYFKGEVIDNCSECEKQCATNEIIFDRHFFEIIQNYSNTNYTQVEDGYYQLNSVTANSINLVDLPISSNIHKADCFLPKSVFEQTEKGEFRDVVSCFISFENTKEWENQVSKVINLAGKYGGYFNRISFGDKGGFLLVFFGAPIAYEKDIFHALAFVLKVQQIKNFTTKVGITSGTAFAGFTGSEYRAEYTCQGRKVNLAARFMMKAKHGEILIDESTASKADDMYEFNKLPQMEFKHFPNKLDVFQLLAIKVTQNPLYNKKLVGRENELEKLNSLIQPVFTKKFAGIVYVDGPAGIGKSGLINEFKRRYIGSSVNWFYMPCDEILQNSFNPIIYFLNSYFNQSNKNSTKVNKSNYEEKLLILREQIQSTINHESSYEILAELERTKSILASLINLHWKGSLFQKLGAKARYSNILIAFKNLVKAEALLKPVIIELEDGHWIDSDTKQLLTVLTGNIEKFPIAIISACRYNDDGSKFSFNLDKSEVTENRIKLEQLLPESSETLVSEYFNGVKLPEETLKLVLDKSEGNPFYIEQICLFVQENKLLDSSYRIQANELKIPSSINAIIISRIDRLTAELKTVVKTASVLGREFATDILSKMLLKTDLSTQLKDGVKERIWESISEIRYLFHHALIREAVYEMQLKEQLRKLHSLAAETIEGVYQSNLEPHYYELANHYEKSELQDKAIEYLKKAGTFAKDNYQNKQAIDLFKRFLLINEAESAKSNTNDVGFYENIEENLIVSRNLAEILKSVGNWDESEQLLLSALELSKKYGNKITTAKLTSSFGYLQHLKGNNDRAMKLLRESLSQHKATGNSKEIIDCLSKIGVIHLRKGNLPEASEHFKEWLDLAEKEKNLDSASMASLNIGSIHMYRGEYEQAMVCYKNRLEYAEKTGNLVAISFAVGNIGILHFNLENYDTGLECLQKKLTICKKIGDKVEISNTLGNMGIFLSYQGNYHKAKELLNEKLSLSKELGNKAEIAKAYGAIGQNLMHTGEFDKALINANKCLQLSEELSDKIEIGIVLSDLGNIYLKKGIFAKALVYFTKELHLDKETTNNKNISRANYNIAYTYKRIKNFSNAVEFYNKAIELLTEDQSTALLQFTVSKAECFYEMKQYHKALKILQQSSEYEIDESELALFQHRVCLEKINLKLANNDKERFQIANNLKELLCNEKESERIALLYFEVAIIYRELNKQKEFLEYRNKAISKYKELYSKIPDYEYKEKLELLEALN